MKTRIPRRMCLYSYCRGNKNAIYCVFLLKLIIITLQLLVNMEVKEDKNEIF